MERKKNILLYMDEDFVERAKEIGLNLSKTCENALKDATERLEGTYREKEQQWLRRS